MRFCYLSLCLIVAATLSLPGNGFAQSKAASKPLGTFGAWKAYTYNEKDAPVCYMTRVAHFAPNKKFKRNDAYLMITHRPGENSKDVVSYAAGYNFKPLSEVTIVIGKKSFDLFTQKDTAWSRDAATDHALAAAIRDGASVKITGAPVAKDIKPLTDAFDLKGATAAYQAIGKACGYPDEKKPTDTHNKKTIKH